MSYSESESHSCLTVDEEQCTVRSVHTASDRHALALLSAALKQKIALSKVETVGPL